MLDTFRLPEHIVEVVNAALLAAASERAMVLVIGLPDDRETQVISDRTYGLRIASQTAGDRPYVIAVGNSITDVSYKTERN